MEKQKVSVIIPVYNVEKYLSQCLDSVINQTLKEIEIICVDDGSTDTSLAILHEYEVKDNRVKVLTQKNLYAGAARNAGMAIARGEYIHFLDSDDYLELDAYETMYKKAIKFDADLLKTKAYRFDDKTGVELADKRWYDFPLLEDGDFERVTNFKEMPEKFVRTNVVPWTGLYKRSFLVSNKIVFNHLFCVNDRSFYNHVILCANRVVFTKDRPVRHRVNREESLVGQRLKHFDCHFNSYKIIESQCSRLDDKKKALILNNELRDVFNWYKKLEEQSNIEQIVIQMKAFLEDIDINLFLDNCDKKTIVWLDDWNRLMKKVEKIKVSTKGDQTLDEQLIKLTSQLSFVRNKNKFLHAEIKAIHNSWSYRIGRFVTWIPRKIRKCSQCYRENGFTYTVRRILVHLHLAKDLDIISIPYSPSPKRDNGLEKCNKIKRNYNYYNSLQPERYEEELKIWYESKKKTTLNLESPKTYDEKIQWMKLYDNTPLKTMLSDKYQVRDWVKEKIGEKYLVPLLGVWNSFEEIDFNELPNQFVLKANHGCGWNVIVKDKAKMDIEAARKSFKTWLDTNFAFQYGFQLQYMNIPPKIIAEEYLENNNNDLYDYKVFCFNGKAESIMFLSERKQELKMAFYNLNWEKLPFVYSHPMNDAEIPKPKNLELLIQLAEKLAEGFAHVRVDFYILNDGTLKFGEMTFSSASGLCKWNPPEQDQIYGDLIQLPPKREIPERLF